nr:MAG TPA: hypothetical protein [Caudoviricetes sp.]
MSKNDMVVRTAQDLERKYNFAQLLGLKKNIEITSQGMIKIENELNSMLNAIVINLKDVLDSQSEISLWFYSGTPTTSNEPYTNWSNPNEHLGDIYYDRSSGKVYQWNNIWEVNTSPDLVEAMAITNSEVDTTGSHERRVFFSTPTIPYTNGDWWIKDDGSLYICQISKTTGSFEDNDFISSNNYTESIAEKIGDEIKVLKGTITTMSESYAKFTDLATGGSTTISGDNITTGTIKSENYVSGISGMKIDLDNGTMDSKNLKLKDNGDLEIGGYIRTDKGILTNLTYKGSAYNWFAEGNNDGKNEWFLGFNIDYEESKNRTSAFISYIYIPDDFVVQEANIVVFHNLAYWNGNKGYCRNIKAYNVTDSMSQIVQAEYSSELSIIPTFSTSNEIKKDGINVMGQNGKTFSQNGKEVFTSEDISSMFKDSSGNTVAGNYNVAIKTINDPPSYSHEQDSNSLLGVHTGFVSMIVNIIGYKKLD